MQSGHYKLTSFDLSTHFDEDMIHIGKFNPEMIFTAVYQDPDSKTFYVKRFIVEPTDRKIDFIGDEEKNRLILVTGDAFPRLEIQFDMKQKSKGAEQEEIILHEFIGVKSYKAKGKRLTTHPVKKVGFLEPLTIPEKVEIPIPVKPEPAPKKKPEKKELKPKEIKPAESSKKESSKKGSKRKHSGKIRHDKGVQMELPL